MSDAHDHSASAAPVTGDAAIDAALSDVAASAQLPLAEHAQRLDRAQAVLADVLRASREPSPGQ